MALKDIVMSAAGIAALGIILSPPARSATDEQDARRLQAAEILKKLLDDRSTQKLPAAEQYSIFAEACPRAVGLLGPESRAAQRITSAMDRWAESDASSAEDSVASLRALLQEIHEDLVFQPIKEANLPVGFPNPTPVGEIEIKQYPKYRMAQADAFWTLFRHIKREKIAMTAPVQMDYEATGDSELDRRSMAFLYESPDQGQPGSDGSVQVVDVAPQLVASIGVRGRRTEAKIEAAQRALQEWLETKSDRYQTDGELRVMGHNSPFVPAKRNYFEVEIPVIEVAQADLQTSR